jgi:hypothetical protein
MKFWHFVMIMVIVAMPAALKYDHYIALLVWSVFLLGSWDEK